MDTSILSNLIIIDFLSATTIFTQKNAKSKKENRCNWAAVIKFEGETEYTCNGKKFISNIDNLMILPGGSSYEWVCTKEGHFCILEFKCDHIHDEILSFPLSDGNIFLKKFRDIEHRATLKKPMHQMEAIRDLYDILLKICPITTTQYIPSDKTKKIAPAMEYIAKNYNKNIKNDELAMVSGLSTVYFRKLFTQIYGTSPITYIQNLRIKKAKEMLKSDYGNITDIALSLGFANVYEFSRAFKKVTGIPPSKY